MSVEEDEGPDERLGLGLARILHRGDDGEVGDGALVGQVDLAVRPELDGVDRAEAPSAGVDALAGRAAQAEQPVVPGRLGGPVGRLGDRIPVGDRGQVVHPGHRFRGAAGVLALGLGGLAGDEADDVVDPTFSGAPPPGRHPHALGHGLGRAGVHRVQQGRGGPVQADECEGEGMVERVLDPRASATHVHDSTVPAGPTSTNSWGSSAPVAGSHSMGGTSTASWQRMPRICFSVRAVMNAPTTGPRDRL